MGHFINKGKLGSFYWHTIRSFETFYSSFHTCEGIHERGQGSVKHLEKRVSARITCRATQHRVLQDVRDPCTVHGSRPELDTEQQHMKLRLVRNKGTKMAGNSGTAAMSTWRGYWSHLWLREGAELQFYHVLTSLQWETDQARLQPEDKTTNTNMWPFPWQVRNRRRDLFQTDEQRSCLRFKHYIIFSPKFKRVLLQPHIPPSLWNHGSSVLDGTEEHSPLPKCFSASNYAAGRLI